MRQSSLGMRLGQSGKRLDFPTRVPSHVHTYRKEEDVITGHSCYIDSLGVLLQGNCHVFCLATQLVDTETWGKPPSKLNTIDGGNYFCAGLMHYSQTPQIQTFAAVQSNTVMQQHLCMAGTTRPLSRMLNFSIRKNSQSINATRSRLLNVYNAHTNNGLHLALCLDPRRLPVAGAQNHSQLDVHLKHSIIDTGLVTLRSVCRED